MRGGQALSVDFERDLSEVGLGQALLDAEHLQADDAERRLDEPARRCVLIGPVYFLAPED